MSLQEIMELSPAERILLVEKIWDSIKPEDIELSQQQKDELDRRLQLDKEGKMQYHDWDTVKKFINERP